MSIVNEMRRRIRAPYRVPGRLEIVGVSCTGEGSPIATCDANEWGMRIESAEAVPRVPVKLYFPAPDGTELAVTGWVIHAQRVCVDSWEAGIEFDTPQPKLAATRIDIAAFGR